MCTADKSSVVITGSLMIFFFDFFFGLFVKVNTISPVLIFNKYYLFFYEFHVVFVAREGHGIINNRKINILHRHNYQRSTYSLGCFLLTGNFQYSCIKPF